MERRVVHIISLKDYTLDNGPALRDHTVRVGHKRLDHVDDDVGGEVWQGRQVSFSLQMLRIVPKAAKRLADMRHTCWLCVLKVDTC